MDMRGSGIYSYEVVIKVKCPNPACSFDDKADVFVDDWKNYYFDCPECEFDEELVKDTPF